MISRRRKKLARADSRRAREVRYISRHLVSPMAATTQARGLLWLSVATLGYHAAILPPHIVVPNTQAAGSAKLFAVERGAQLHGHETAALAALDTHAARGLKSDDDDEGLGSQRQQGECDVTLFGAMGNNRSYDTAAVAAAILHCRRAYPHGATVRFPAPGKYLIGQTNVTSNMTLFIEGGATIVGSPRKRDYPRGVPVYGRDPEYKPLIFSEGTVNVKILGSNGTIDGNGWAGGWVRKACPIHWTGSVLL